MSDIILCCYCYRVRIFVYSISLRKPTRLKEMPISIVEKRIRHEILNFFHLYNATSIIRQGLEQQ